MLKEVELAAKALGVKLQYLDVLDPKDIETAFRAASKGRADAVLVLASAILIPQREQIAELAVKNRLPVMYSQQPVRGSRRAYVLRRERHLTWIVVPPPTWTRSSKAPSPRIFQSSSRRSSSSSSI